MLASLIAGLAGPHHWLTMTPAGFFTAGSRGGELLSIVRGFEVISIAQIYHRLYRPDLVEEMLKGDVDDKHHNAAAELNLQGIYESGPPPQVELLHKRTERDDDLFKFVVRLTDVGGGIGEEVWWRVNGKTRGNITRPALAGLPGPGSYAIMPQELRLDLNQKNEIEVIAFNSKGLRSSQPLLIPIDKGGTSGENPHLHVLVIGVDNYSGKSLQLTHAKHDATAIAEALKKVAEGTFWPENIHIAPPLLDADATE